MAKSSAILGAALELFEHRNYESTPVPLLARQAGVGAGTIYRYFPGKQGVVNALYRRWKRALAEAVTDGLDMTAPAHQMFDGIWRRLCGFALTHPAAFAFLETHHHRPYLDAESRQVAEDLDQLMAELTGRWQRDGIVRSGDPALLVAQVYGGLVGVVRAHRDRGRELPADLADQTIEGAWNLMASPTQERIMPADLDHRRPTGATT